MHVRGPYRAVRVPQLAIFVLAADAVLRKRIGHSARQLLAVLTMFSRILAARANGRTRRAARILRLDRRDRRTPDAPQPAMRTPSPSERYGCRLKGRADLPATHHRAAISFATDAADRFRSIRKARR
jgi:hypothetical protein